MALWPAGRALSNRSRKAAVGVAHPADGHHLPGKPRLPQLPRQTAALRQTAAEQQHHVRPGRAEGVLQRGGVQLGHIPPGQKLCQGVEVPGVLCKAGHWFSSSRKTLRLTMRLTPSKAPEKRSKSCSITPI